MSKGQRRQEAREAKYSPMGEPKMMVGLRGRVHPVYPEPRATKHGKPPEKPERSERWQ